MGSFLRLLRCLWSVSLGLKPYDAHSPDTVQLLFVLSLIVSHR